MKEIARQQGISEGTIYRWKAKFRLALAGSS
jgi:transposase